MIFNKNKENEWKKEIQELRSDMNALSKNMIGLSIAVNTFMSEVKKELPEFADTIISELNNSLDDLIYIPKSEDRCELIDGVDKDDYILQVHQRLSKNKNHSRIYKPYNLYFDGYNFINRIGVNRGKISFTINDIDTIKNNLGSVCETIVDDGFKYHSIYHNFHVSRNVFPKLLFNIIEGTFNDIERFKENPINK